MILNRYFAQKLRQSVASLLIVLTLLLSTQALLISLKNFQAYSLPLVDLIFFFVLELCSSCPLIFSFSFIIGWLTWRRSLEDTHEEHAALVSGWSGWHTRALGFKRLLLLSFLNFCLVFIIVPVSNHFINKNITLSLTPQALEFYPAETPIKINKEHVLYFKNKGNDQLNQVSIITTKNNQPLATYAESAVINLENNGLELKNGFIHDMRNTSDFLNFESMDFILMPVVQKISRSGMTIAELHQSSPSLALGELSWRIFLILQPWIIMAGFLNKKVALRKNSQFNRLVLEALFIFCGTTLLGLLTSKLFHQGLYHHALICGSILVFITIAGLVRSFLHDQ